MPVPAIRQSSAMSCAATLIVTFVTKDTIGTLKPVSSICPANDVRDDFGGMNN